MNTYRFDVERYERLFHAGILTDEDHIELLDGDLIVQSPIGSRHANVVFDLTRDLVLVHQQADPDAAAYTVYREVPAHDVLAPVAFPDLFLPLPALFGQARH